MSIETAGIETVVVDSVSLVQSVIDAVMELRTDIPSLFIDLEGVDLGRHGSISIMSLYLPSNKRVYLIDIYGLKTEAFSTVNSDGKSIKAILESSVILKVLFDVRHDSDALFSHYGISVDGIRDVQLMELGTREGAKDYLAGLDRCVEKDSTISATEKKAWGLIKGNGRRLFDPTLGGRYETFNERPIPQAIAEYCAGDVTLLPDLFKVYSAKLNRPGEAFWEHHVLEATAERIRLSRSPRFDGTSKSNARGPWDRESIEEAINQWNDDVLDNALSCGDDEFFGLGEFDDDCGWQDDGPTSCRDIINDCDYEYYYSD
jgi:exonuclease 3'-5' domain-containing protein 1